ncbi:uncharacterized protein LOC143230005 isoform X2 [Tachypleus tridentatus]
MNQDPSTVCVAGDGNSSSRLQRNLAEKHRREKLNGYINELANIVPMVSMATRRLNKTSILRLSAAHLRMYQSLRNKSSKLASRWHEGLLNEAHLKELIEAIDGFVLVTTSNGKIVYISHSVERFLGHQHIEMIGHTLLSFVHPDDVGYVRQQFQDLSTRIIIRNGELGSLSKISFRCRLREHSQPRSEIITYQLAEIKGHVEGETNHDSVGSSTELLFKAFVRVIHSSPISELSLPEALQDVYVTRHKIDGTIIYTDHRISTITGHLPHEVLGLSAYMYIMPDDIPVALFKHNLMFSSSGEQATIVYRLKTRNHSWVYLKSFGELKYDNSSGQIDHFVCVNHVLSEEDGKHELQEFTQRYMPHINSRMRSFLFQSIQSAQSGDFHHMQEVKDVFEKLKSSHSPQDELTHSNDCSSAVKAEMTSSDKDENDLDGGQYNLGQNFPALHAALTNSSYPVTSSTLKEHAAKTTTNKEAFEEASEKTLILEWKPNISNEGGSENTGSTCENISPKLNSTYEIKHSPSTFPMWTSPPVSYLQTQRRSNFSIQSEESDYEKCSSHDGDLSLYPADAPEVECPFDDRRSSVASVYSSASEPETYHSVIPALSASQVVFDSQTNEPALAGSQDSTLIITDTSASANADFPSNTIRENMPVFPRLENTDIEILSFVMSDQCSKCETAESAPNSDER